jgi:hypothetical protein
MKLLHHTCGCFCFATLNLFASCAILVLSAIALLHCCLVSCKQNPASCDCCSHARMSHHCWWNRHVANPIKYHGYQGGRWQQIVWPLPHALLQRAAAIERESVLLVMLSCSFAQAVQQHAVA